MTEIPAPRQLPTDEVLDPNRFMQYETSVLRSSTVQQVLEQIDRPGLSLCDVGGASGVFVQEIARRAAHPIDGFVLEVNDDYSDRQVDPSTGFIQASILDSGLADERFDIMTFRHVLHHLVSGTAKSTLELQRRAVSEMLRLIKPGGHLIFEEQVNLVKPFSRIVFHLSLLASRKRLRWRYFEAGTVVVSFMTPGEIAVAVDAAAKVHPLRVLHRSTNRRHDPLRWKLTLLMAFGANVSYVIRKQAAQR